MKWPAATATTMAAFATMATVVAVATSRHQTYTPHTKKKRQKEWDERETKKKVLFCFDAQIYLWCDDLPRSSTIRTTSRNFNNFTENKRNKSILIENWDGRSRFHLFDSRALHVHDYERVINWITNVRIFRIEWKQWNERSHVLQVKCKKTLRQILQLCVVALGVGTRQIEFGFTYMW